MPASVFPAPPIRPSTEADLPAIAAIYRHHVTTGLASFEETPPDLAELARRRAAVLEAGLAWIVAEDNSGCVVGYAYAALFRPRSAYRYTVEDSIYIAPGRTGQGIGRALLASLVEDAAAKGYRQMVAVIGDSANAASIALHRRLGFREAGRLDAVGFKFGRWVDSVLMQRPLGAGATGVPSGPPTRA